MVAMNTLRALSLRQPWAELILSGKKTIETRTWNTSYRGTFWIHASIASNPDHMKEFGFGSQDFNRGAIVGSAELVSVIAYPSLAAFQADASKHCVRIDHWEKPLFGYVLSNVKRIEPIPCKGMLNFFPLPDSVVTELQKMN